MATRRAGRLKRFAIHIYGGSDRVVSRGGKQDIVVGKIPDLSDFVIPQKVFKEGDTTQHFVVLT
jgi:hypothetical protein